MKDERLAILSMVEKGVISVEEAERLFSAIDRKDDSATNKVGDIFSKAGEGLSSLAKSVSKKTGKIVEDAKPAMKKAGDKLNEVVEDAKPAMKKAGDKLNEVVEDARPVMKKAAEAMAEQAEKLKRKDDDLSDFNDEEFFENSEDNTEDQDFVTEVVIAPLDSVEEEIIEKVIEETDSKDE